MYDFNSISSRLLQADFNDYTNVLSKFIGSPSIKNSFNVLLRGMIILLNYSNSPALREQRQKDPIFHVVNVIKMLHCVKGFFEVPPCASPTTAICHPNELNTDNVSCFFRYHLIASGGFVELGTTTSIEVSFNDIDGFICFYYEVPAFCRGSFGRNRR